MGVVFPASNGKAESILGSARAPGAGERREPLLETLLERLQRAVSASRLSAGVRCGASGLAAGPSLRCGRGRGRVAR